MFNNSKATISCKAVAKKIIQIFKLIFGILIPYLKGLKIQHNL